LKRFDGVDWVNGDSYPNVVGGKFSDGTYCYTVASGVITSKIVCQTTLSVYYEAGFYYASLNDALSASVTISFSSTDVSGYTDGSCNNPSGEQDAASSSLVISAGSFTTSQSGVTALTVSSSFYKFDGNLSVNGTSVADFGTIVIGGTTVTVNYPQACFSYNA
jgi:hypothetical protein